MLDRIRGQIGQAHRRIQTEWRAQRRRSYPQALILMYHRVAPKDVDPWTLRVTPENFEAHLQVLKQHTQPMGLRELALAQRSGNVPERAVAITFDDGYANNLHQAKPLLTKHQIPATVFVSTGYTESGREFWSDELERLLLSPGTLPPTLPLTVGGQCLTWDLGDAIHYSEADYQTDHDRYAWNGEPGTRMHLYHQLWAALQPLDHQERQAAMDTLLNWAGADISSRHSHRPMTSAELSELEAGGLVTIGAHTVNHPMLSEHSLDYQQQEIQASKTYLETVLHHPVDTFAYPFGDYHPETLPLLEQDGFLCACTIVEETVWQGNHPLELPRFKVGNWSKPEFETRLRRWMTRGYSWGYA